MIDIKSQQRAAQAFVKLCNDAQDVKELYENASMELPPALATFFGANDCDDESPPHRPFAEEQLDALVEKIRRT